MGFGESALRFQRIKGCIDKSKPFIWAIWAIVIANTALGLFKPSF